ncbi:thiamine pyrophosphate-requiring protein [Stygiolobus caldivivus]|uniref:2-oxoacid oxidoreductase (ferredoxin) n=1 Tax=Stygiolobus caldivivus TaxID=2824673 RepID=A0A8D5U509_9CREN|nr:thiamine pyrophosphate-requiring protein [Stygiolobus caldivivus]BCU69610.1 acetolactate synthase [Stygiolobus caldivivus]
METGAKILLSKLRELGVDRIFMVSGTDYAAFIEEKVKDPSLPEFVIVPHEITAASAALGYSIAGKVGVVALHTIPGTANALGIIINAFTSRVPLIVLAGRSPYTEEGSTASRNLRIHWTQEARDQGEVVRQWVKWDFEIRRVEQIESSVNRAFQIAFSEPTGPVYLMVPREVSVEKTGRRNERPLGTYSPGVKREDLEKARKMIQESDNPVIVTWRAGRKREWFDSLKGFVDEVGIPVLNYVGEVVNYEGEMGLDHYDISNADLVIVVESEVPWIPKRVRVKGKVIKVDVDPSYSYIPYYGFPCDLCVQSTVSEFFSQLKVAEKAELKEKVREAHREQERKKAEEVEKYKKMKTIHPRLLSYYVGKLGLTVFNEYQFNPRYAKLGFGQYFADPGFGHLGWAIGGGFGYSLATGKKVVVTVGDGSFIFGVPEAFYYAVATYGGDVLVVIYDNGGWLASAEAVDEVFPEGLAKAKGEYPGADFRRYNIGETVKGFGGYYKLIESPEEIEESLKEGLKHKLSVVQAIVDKTR